MQKGKLRSMKVNGLLKGGNRVLNKFTEHGEGGGFVSRELQMVPKYLECAKLHGKDLYRFNPMELKELSSAFSKYQTKLPMTDILKELLAIGNDGKVKSLSVDEIKAFLTNTTGMRNQQQKNVLKFLQVSRQEVPAKLTIKQLESQYPYEEYKAHRIAMDEQYGHSTSSYTDEYFRKLYSGFLNNEFRIRTNFYYAEQLKSKEFSFTDHLLRNDSKLIKAVSEITDSKSLYEVLKISGASDNVIAASKDLVRLYQISNGNKFLIKDLASMFYPAEIKHIREALEAELNLEESLAAINRYSGTAEENQKTLKTTRAKILSLLNISGDVKLLPLRTVRNEDVYKDKTFGLIRGGRITGGNYERGKKK